jgi:hypothetical protein
MHALPWAPPHPADHRLHLTNNLYEFSLGSRKHKLNTSHDIITDTPPHTLQTSAYSGGRQSAACCCCSRFCCCSLRVVLLLTHRFAAYAFIVLRDAHALQHASNLGAAS